MTGELEQAVLAVDGGGTGSRLALATPGGVTRIDAGPANVFTDFEGAVANLDAGLSRLAEAAGLSGADLRALPACFALAGVIDDAIALRVRLALTRPDARVEDDRAATVEGALGGRDGAVAALGTGSFFAVVSGGAIRLAGGWGARVDDRASGFWIGREALRAALAAADGVGPASALTDALLARFHGPSGIATFAGRASPGEVAAFAPEVAGAAREGDSVARDILARAGAHALATLAALGARPEAPLCLVGGAARAVGAALPEAARSRLVAPCGTALDGALARARRLAAGASL